MQKKRNEYAYIIYVYYTGNAAIEVNSKESISNKSCKCPYQTVSRASCDRVTSPALELVRSLSVSTARATRGEPDLP